MSRLYLIRHGQAGPRHDYDRLSALGEQQAQSLGRYLVSLKIEFAAAYVGRLARQRRTAEAVQAEFQATGFPFPDLVEEPLWDEFDLDHVYQELAAPLGLDDPRFQQEFAAMTAATAWASALILSPWIPMESRFSTWRPATLFVSRLSLSLDPISWPLVMAALTCTLAVLLAAPALYGSGLRRARPYLLLYSALSLLALEAANILTVIVAWTLVDLAEQFATAPVSAEAIAAAVGGLLQPLHARADRAGDRQSAARRWHASDWRPEIHDSDGLAIWRGSGEWI